MEKQWVMEFKEIFGFHPNDTDWRRKALFQLLCLSVTVRAYSRENHFERFYKTAFEHYQPALASYAHFDRELANEIAHHDPAMVPQFIEKHLSM